MIGLPKPGPALRRLRKRSGLTLQQLADRTGVHVTTILRSEQPNANPRWVSVDRYLKAMRYGPQDLARAIVDLALIEAGDQPAQVGESPTQNLGDAIRTLRMSKKVPIHEVAAMSNVGRYELEDFEAGLRGLRTESLGEVMKALRLTVGDLARTMGDTITLHALQGDLDQLRNELRELSEQKKTN